MSIAVRTLLAITLTVCALFAIHEGQFFAAAICALVVFVVTA